MYLGNMKQGWPPLALDSPEVIGCINFQQSWNRKEWPAVHCKEVLPGTFWHFLQQYSTGSDILHVA